MIGNAREPSSYVGRARHQSERDRIDRHFNVAARRRLGAHVLHRCGRGLSSGEPVNLVVHHDVRYVDVAPHRMNEVTDAYAVAVAIASGDHHVEIVIGELDSFGDSHRAPVKTVDAVGVNEPRKIR